MSNNIINLNLGTKALTFNFGEFNLDYLSDDEKDDKLRIKSQELTEKASALESKEAEMDDREIRQNIKSLIDEFFEILFDADAPQKIYEAAGKHTWNYLNVFLQISASIQKEWDKKRNDENFKKYLAE
ncbi:TPA: hypothetical protein U1W51_000913 [Streptococcus suis]|nr:hypothetical protein [Streptococcus suis]HEM4137346.1 hypothetical protein [Streptococcus suis]